MECTHRLEHRLACPKYAYTLHFMTPRDAFPGNDEPVNIDADPEDALRALLGEGGEEGEPDAIEPVLDE